MHSLHIFPIADCAAIFCLVLATRVRYGNMGKRDD